MIFTISPGLTFVPRADWGADASLPRRGHRVARNRRNKIIFHHTVMIDTSDTSPNIWETEAEVFNMMKRLQVVRRADLGADVPYNFVAFFMAQDDGMFICEGRGEDRTGAHTPGQNTDGIAISLAGNFHNLGTDAAEITKRLPLFSAFISWLKFSASHPDYGNFPPMQNLGSKVPDTGSGDEREVFGHRDFNPTACPGDEFFSHLGQITFLEPPAV